MNHTKKTLTHPPPAHQKRGTNKPGSEKIKQNTTTTTPNPTPKGDKTRTWKPWQWHHNHKHTVEFSNNTPHQPHQPTRASTTGATSPTYTGQFVTVKSSFADLCEWWISVRLEAVSSDPGCSSRVRLSLDLSAQRDENLRGDSRSRKSSESRACRAPSTTADLHGCRRRRPWRAAGRTAVALTGACGADDTPTTERACCARRPRPTNVTGRSALPSSALRAPGGARAGARTPPGRASLAQASARVSTPSVRRPRRTRTWRPCSRSSAPSARSPSSCLTLLT